MINELYDGISDQVLEKYNASDIAHQRAEDLLRRASNLATALTTSNKSLQSKSFIFIYCVKNAWILINALKIRILTKQPKSGVHSHLPAISW